MKSDAQRKRLLGSGDDWPQAIALDDPVPSGSCVAVVEGEHCPDHPHDVEAEVQRMLLGSPDLEFTSLVVRRVPQGVCLEGVLHGASSAHEVADLARMVSGVDVVINHLLVCAQR